jgi:hypothetical protein
MRSPSFQEGLESGFISIHRVDGSEDMGSPTLQNHPRQLTEIYWKKTRIIVACVRLGNGSQMDAKFLNYYPKLLLRKMLFLASRAPQTALGF